MFEADDVGEDCLMQVFIVACGDGDGEPLALVVDLDDDLWGFELLDLLLRQLLPCFLFELVQVAHAGTPLGFALGLTA